VQIMTIHGAKGLGFDHVYVMQLHKSPPTRRGEVLAEAGEVDGRLEYQLFGAPTLDFEAIERKQREVEEAERVRTLYVAMTRARERLVLSGLRPEVARGGAKASHMELLTHRERWPALGELASELLGSDLPGRVDLAETRWLVPALAHAEAEAPRQAVAAAPLCDPEAVADAARVLAKLRDTATAHASRPFRAAASEESKDAREELAFRWHGDVLPASEIASPEPSSSPRPADLARHVGTAIHRALESMDLAADPAVEMPRQRAKLERILTPLLPPDALVRARRDAEALLDRLAGGQLIARLRALETRIVARELPVLLPPAEDAGPVGFVAGAVDLVYRDPETDALVVADYKTDAVETQPEIDARATRYEAQGRAYVRAVREALALPYDPRFELWFLCADRIHCAG
jgi:ATP-dependent exoDNAse (exonuclease V) beta subunit